jgi:hypothetical protein
VCTIVPGNFSGSTQVFAGLKAQIEKTFEKLPDAVKSDYGQAYLQAWMDKWVKG